MFEDILQETEIYRYIKEKGVKEATQRELQHQREMLLPFVQARFPKLVRFATKQASIVTDAEVLDDLIYKIGLAQLTEDEARQLFSDLDNVNNN